VDLRKLRRDDYKTAEVIILADCQRIQGNDLAELDKFVKAGGGLLIFAGPEIDIDYYNRELFRKGEGLLPAAIKGMARAEIADSPARVLMQRLTHPSVLYFNDARGGRLQDAEFRSWIEFAPPPNENTQRILSLDRNLPLQPFFVPLMQRLTTYLATEGSAPAWQLVGSTLLVNLEKAELGAEFTLRDPTGQSQTLKSQQEGDKVFVQSPPIAQPGIFQLQRVGTNKTTFHAFNTDNTESDLKPLPADQIKKIADRHEASFADSLPGYQALDRTRRHGSELWQPLLIALLALLFFEVLLQQRIAKG
jgi:hypothetical protein